MNRNNNNTLSTQLYRSIKFSSTIFVKQLLDSTSIQVNDTFDESNGTEYEREDIGKTPLQYAVEKYQTEILELLLKNGADVNTKLNSKMSLIQYACQESNQKVVKILIDYGADVNYVDPSLKERYTCLHYAVESQGECTVELLVNEGSFINATAENNITPLHIAAKKKHNDSFFFDKNNILKILLENGADVNAQTNDKKTALYFAAQEGHLSAVQTILEHNPDKNIEGNLSSLGVAISCNHTDGIKASYFTSQAKHMNILRNDGLSKPVSNIKKNINYRYAEISCYHSTIVNHLIDYGLTLEPQHEYYKMFIFAAASIGHLKIIENFLTSESCDVNLSVDPSSENSTRILHTSIINNHTDISLLLIENGADVHVKDENNKSPVYYAVTNNNTEVTKKLVAHHAEVQPVLLHCAVRNDNLEMIKILVKCKVDINTILEVSYFLPEDRKLTPLLIATKKKNVSVIQYLVEHGANINFVDIPDGYPALYYAVENKNEKIVNMLINRGANINLRYGEDNRTVLCSAVQTIGDIEMIKLLLEKGADVNCQNKSGSTPLNYIIGQKNFNSQIRSEIIELLLQYNADINCKSKFGMTPLHYATYVTEYDKKGDIRIIESLLKFGADIDSTDESCRTALYYAIYKKNEKSFRTLLDNGADINIMLGHDGIGNKYESLYKIATIFYERQKYQSTNSSSPTFDSDYHDYDEDSDFSGFSDDDDAWRPEWKIIEMLKEHIIQLNQAKCWINEGNLQAINSSEDSSTSSHMLDLCKKEISNMKIEKIGKSCVTFHDVLMNNFDKFGRNKNVMEILELEEYKKKYPIYGKIITGNYRRAKFRIPLQKEFINLFCCQWDRFKELPYICVEKICTYLSLQDMRELINPVKKSLYLLENYEEMNRNNNYTLSTQLYRAIRISCIDSVKQLLNRTSIQVNDTFDESNGTEYEREDIGKTPLQYAVEKYRTEILELLLKNGADVNTKVNSKMSLIQYACQGSNQKVVKILIDYGADVNYVDPSLEERYTCLHYAVRSQHESTVQLLVNEGSCINATAENNITPLHIAAKKKHNDSFYFDKNNILKILLENGADVNAQTNDKKTALYFAAQEGHLDSVQTILKHNPDKNIEGNLSSLGVAISCDHSDGMKASYFTSQAKHMDILNHYRLSKPVSNIKGDINYRYSRNACNHSTIVNLLIDYGLTLEPQHEYYKMFIFAAASIGHLRIIENFLTSNSCDVNLLVNPSSKNPTRILHLSTINNHTDISLLLIENGADVNVRDGNGKSPVHYAVTNNNTEVTKKLLACHAEVQPIFLHCAIRNDNLEIVKVLVERGIDVNTIFEISYFFPDDRKLTPLFIALEKNNDSVIQYLVEHGANVNFIDSPDGCPPLHYAVTNKNKNIVNILLNKGANVNLKYGKKKTTVLCLAVQTIGDIEIIKLLLEKGADVNCQDKSGSTPFYYSIGQQEFNSQITYEIIKLLLKYNADINYKSRFGVTPLHYATINTEYDKEDDTRIIELLLKFGADINATDEFCRTALCYAIYKRKTKSFRTLLDNGADINIMIKLNEKENKHESLYEIATSVRKKQMNSLKDTSFFERQRSRFRSTLDFDYFDQDFDDRSDDYGFGGMDKKIIEMLKEHIIQLNQAKCWINEGNLKAINSSNGSTTSSHMLDLCNKEISNMKIEKIGNSCVTLHDVLINDFDKFGRNKHVMEILELEEYKKKYPIYGKIITGHYIRAKFRIPLQNEFINSFCCQCYGFNQLPYICVEKICTYLSLQDMKELINYVNKLC
ncbi:uncharacterized protein LOC122847395 [Aphidius gifuensis]|uniref:uncharacterized protein LOC122847395 n=1 Tax=Aphidius gifuensis TaxID=684658 RepID=UPI001CDB981F|nr:uncharacterized protein LOC122847395 [Aphidius gifuensis]